MDILIDGILLGIKIFIAVITFLVIVTIGGTIISELLEK